MRGGNIPQGYVYPRERRSTVQRAVDLDLDLIAVYDEHLGQVEWYIEKHAKAHDYQIWMLLRSVPGIGALLALVFLYEIDNIDRFPTVPDFASYCRLIKCQSQSAGNIYGTSGAKIGNAHLKWAFSEAAVLFLRESPEAKKYVERLTQKHGKGKALSIFAHKIGRAVYFIWKRKKPFDQKQFFGLNHNRGNLGFLWREFESSRFEKAFH